MSLPSPLGNSYFIFPPLWGKYGLILELFKEHMCRYVHKLREYGRRLDLQL